MSHENVREVVKEKCGNPLCWSRPAAVPVAAWPVPASLDISL
jgi:hypothetical protein